MPSGLQCWDAAGNMTFDVNTMTNRAIGYMNIASSGTYTIPTTASPGKTPYYFFYVSGTADVNFGTGTVDVNMTVSGSQLHLFYGER